MSEEIKNEEMTEQAISEDNVCEDKAAPEKEASPKKKLRELEAQLLNAQKELEELKAAMAEQSDKYLRLAAEYENFRKRTAKEREHLYADVYAEALAAFLPVVDNLERAACFADGESVSKGVEMTLKGMKDTLEKLGITEIEAQGQPFDPELHNAVLHVEDDSVGESVVVEVLQKGYRKGDRILRYAVVKVAN